MPSKYARQALKETPKEIREKVIKYGNDMTMKTKEELSKLAKRAKEVALAINKNYKESEFDGISIDIEGNIWVNFSYSCYGSYEQGSVELSEEDIVSPIEVTQAKYKKIEDDEAKRLAKLKLEKEQKKKLDLEKRELETYQKLKEKFEK